MPDTSKHDHGDIGSLCDDNHINNWLHDDRFHNVDDFHNDGGMPVDSGHPR